MRYIHIYLLCLSLLTACTPPKLMKTKQPLNISAAAHTLANNLITQLHQQNLAVNNTLIMFDPFVDASSGEIVQASQQFEHLLFKNISKNHPAITIQRLNPQKFEEADYVLNGIFEYIIADEEQGRQEGFYRISSSMITVKEGKIVANEQLWLFNEELDFTPIATYQDSPMFLRDDFLQALINTAKGNVGKKADRRYYHALEANALIAQASLAYETQDYARALSYYEQAAALPEGKMMKTFAGLYQTYRKLGKMAAAEIAFRDLFALGVENNNLSTKFLFVVNSTEFINNPAIKAQYQIWLRQIAQFFRQSEYCIHILGHSSRTGAEKYNEGLSLRRAKKVQTLLAKYFPGIIKHSKTVGRGFLDNIVGSGTDDARDAVDRRVDFFVVDCDRLQQAIDYHALPAYYP